MGHHTHYFTTAIIFFEEEAEKGLTQHDEKAKKFLRAEHKQEEFFLWACAGQLLGLLGGGKKFLSHFITFIARHKRFGALARHVETVEVLEPRAHWWWWWWW